MTETEATYPDLTSWAHAILSASDAAEKAGLTFRVCRMWNSGKLPIGPARPFHGIPPRSDGVRIVSPKGLVKRGNGGTVESRIKMLHSLAAIEQWAIDLAWDIIARFADFRVQSPDGTLHGLEKDFFDDFVRMAAEEANHFNLLRTRLKELGTDYGCLPAHAGLWDSANTTSHDLLCRLVIVHMVHEARGLDVNPATIAKFQRAGDLESVRKLCIIQEDEISHVSTGTKHFTRLTSLLGLPSTPTFHSIFRSHYLGNTKPPFNDDARRMAGMEREWYEGLIREGGATETAKEVQNVDVDVEGEVSKEGAMDGKGCLPKSLEKLSGERFPALRDDQMTPEQIAARNGIVSGPRGGVVGPFNALLRSPVMCEVAQKVGAAVRFQSSLPAKLNEMAIIMAGRHWNAQFEFYAHRLLAEQAGLSPAICDAIAENRVPQSMPEPESTIYRFCTELLKTTRISDATYESTKKLFGEKGVVDIIVALGYYSLVSVRFYAINVVCVP
ncbi:hypothetical protein HDU93_002572 [Gonapodya sp. JEL0774]|nr:hypothetical protein HDU93_002572 [Gonapodya sp. JEL0774]